MMSLSRLIGEGFRVFFLAAGSFALANVGLWTVWFADPFMLPTAAPPAEWHAHEMVFGYGAAALGGFFLTAVPNWTGAKAARHLFIGSAAAIWFAGRIAVLFSGTLPLMLVAAIDLAFLPVLAAKIATQLVRRPKPQNLMFLVLLGILWVSNLLVHLDWLGVTSGTARRGTQGGLYLLAAMIAVLGGRITPAFTRNAMTRAGRDAGLPRSFGPLDSVAVGAAVAVPVLAVSGFSGAVTGGVAIVAGAAQLARLSFWRWRFTFDKPILWSLHLSYAMVAIGLFMTGLAQFGFGSGLAALHVLAIGGIGGMTLAVMSRASLGHTGRTIVAPSPVVLAYALLPVAAGVRWVASTFQEVAYPATLAAGLLWVVAFGLYLLALWPVLWGPRLQSERSTT